MENIFLYFIKTSGLIALFYSAYILLLRKETFFNGNRWFLLLGLITSSILPLFFITKIIWIEPIEPTALDWSNIPITTVENNPEPEINWSLIAIVIYFLGSIVLFVKLLFDFYSLFKVFKGKVSKQQGKFKLIDVTENMAPFSFFKSIVYNSTLYTPTELENILEHEKVHSSQYHSVDVLLSRLFCIAFWFNPLIWLYKKAMIQNLEFIADNKAAKNSSDKKAYQLTLLKITTQENCVAITNHFYQSLIKKRIIMLNKNQSKKWNSWKYISVFPALVAFVFLFQIEVVAQEKPIKNEVKETKKDSTELKSFKIEKDLSNLSKDKDIYINGEKSTQEELDKLNPNDIEKIDVAKIKGKEVILVTPKHLIKPVKITDKDIYIDGVKSTNDDFNQLDQSTVDKVDVNTFENTIRITTKKVNKNDNQNNDPNKETEKINENPNKKIIKSYLKEFYIDEKKSTATEYSKLDINNIEKVETDPFENKVIITTKKSNTRNSNQILKKDIKTNLKNVSKAIDSIESRKLFKNALVIIDGKKTDYESLLKIKDKNIKFTHAVIFERSTDESKKIALATYGEKARNGVLVVETSPLEKEK